MIRRAHLLTMIAIFITLFLAVIVMGKMLCSSNSILFLVHLVVTITTLFLYAFLGWRRFIGDYVYDRCHLKEYENFLYPKKIKNKTTKKVLRDLSFMTGNNTLATDQAIENFMQVEKEVLSESNTEAISEQVLLALKHTDGNYIPYYTGVIELIMQGNYQDALKKLDCLNNQTNMADIPRQFYTAYILDKIGGSEDEIKSCISFLLNRGGDTRYSEYVKQYINARNIVEDEADSKDLLEIPRLWIVFAFYAIWIVLLYLLV